MGHLNPDLALLAGPDRDRWCGGLFAQNQLNFGPYAVDPLEIGRTLFLISLPVGLVSHPHPADHRLDQRLHGFALGPAQTLHRDRVTARLVFLLGIASANSVLALAAFTILLSFSTNIARGPFPGATSRTSSPTSRSGSRARWSASCRSLET
jgi:hypothetical protein